MRFTENGILAADTNLVERGMRPIAVGRKAWLFAGPVRGGEAAAIAFSLIETCKLNGVEPYAYLKDVLSHPNIWIGCSACCTPPERRKK